LPVRRAGASGAGRLQRGPVARGPEGAPPGKLIEAAEHWARLRLGRQADPGDAAIAELRELGADALADSVEDNRPSDAFEIRGGDAWGTLQLWLAGATQWRVQAVPLGNKSVRLIHFGLDYAGVEAAVRMAGLASSPDRFEELRTMEAAALRILNEH
jgi:hypothetical protein